MRGNNKDGCTQSVNGKCAAGKRFVRGLSLVLAIVMILSMVPMGIFAEEAVTLTATQESNDSDYASTNFSESSYSVYREAHAGDPVYDGEDVVIGVDDITADTNMNYEIYEEYNGEKNVVLLKDQTVEQEQTVTDELEKDKELVPTELAYVTFNFEAPKSALYEIKLNYFPIVTDKDGNVVSNGASIERGFMIDGEYPFDEMRSVSFSRVWKDTEVVGTSHDSSGNEIKSNTEEAPVWRTESLNGDETYYYDSFLVYIEAGAHTMSVVSKRSDLLVKNIVLTKSVALPTYEQVSAEYAAKGYKVVSESAMTKLEAEQTLSKSSSDIYPYHSRSSVLNTALSGEFTYDHTQINVIGGEMWDNAGQWVTWEFKPSETGLYMINLRGRQNVSRGISTGRALTINGEYPFEEAKDCSFYYSPDFGYYTLGQTNIDTEGEEGAFLFYFEAGKTYEIGLEATLGPIENLARKLDDSVNVLMTIYRHMLALCGNDPDEDTDYQFDKYLPDEMKAMAEESAVLRALSEELFQLTGEKSADSAVLDRTADRLDKMVKRPILINKNFTSFKNDISAIANWILNLQKQPLEIDSIFFSGSKAELPDVKPGLFRTLGHETKLLWSSFIVDYTSVGSSVDGDSVITVWFTPSAANSVTGGGREQAQILKRLIEDNFNREYPDIGVNLQIISIDALLPATLAGKGPDVVIGVTSNKPVNYAMRGAVIDLSQFDDCDEILKRFYPSSYTSFTYLDGVYALPETMNFQMMYYRTDIFEENGWEVPNSWEDVYDIIPELANSYMEFGFSSAITNLFTLTFQNHGVLYRGEDELFGYKTGLDTDEAVAAFIMYVNLYRSYGVNLTIDFQTRFRTGEVPLGIEDVSMVTKLAVSAPEIAGNWTFTLVPGKLYKTEDGSEFVDHSAGASGNGTIILAKSELQDESWEFLKWWTSDSVQIQYCNEVEATMGIANRIMSANKSVVYTQGWSTEELNIILTARSWTDGIPEVPGSYYTERHMNNAFTRTYNLRTDPRETLLDYIDEINLELTKKRIEFGLPTADDVE